MKLKSAVLSVLIVSSVVAFGQTPKTLLWRISGKGLAQPSYLFGTMHLNDKRLFQLGDSLYAAIERTSGFAIEVNPDEMAAYLLNNLFADEKSKSLKDILSKEAYDKYAAALSKKMGIPAENITVKDIVQEKNKWVSDYLEKGEMPTFLDAYLYNIAKRQGKWVGGIEDISDQAGLLEDLVDESDIIMLLSDDYIEESVKKALEDMRKVYISEDLDEIERISSGFDDRDALLLVRNIKMARRMDSLSAIRTMFFAVGAAHLPGDSGVISLLKKRGFTVEPVMSSKKLDASKYTFKEVELPWVTVTDTTSFYTVTMPSPPTDVDIMGVFTMKFLLDITTTSGYCTMAMGNPGPGSDEELIESFSKSIFQKKKLGSKKVFERNGLKVIEYRQSAADGKMRMQLFVKNRIVYMAMMYGPKKDAIISPQAEKFFNSFLPLPTKEKTTGFSFSDRNKDVTFNTPARMNYNKVLSQEDDGTGWKVATYMGSDLTAGSYYLFIERKVQKGYYLNDFSVLLEQFKEGIPGQISKVIYQGERSFKNGSGYYVKGTNTKSKELITHILYTYRDNRIYMFSAIGSNDDEAAFNDFFNSIEFLPYKKAELKQAYGLDSAFFAPAPSPFEWSYSSDSTSRQMMSFDEHSSTPIYVFTDTLDNYYWTESEDSLWSEKIRFYNTSPDSVTQITDIRNGDAKGKEIWIHRPGNSYNRIRMFRDSTVIYYISAYAQKDHLSSATIEKLFTELRLTHPVRSYDITVSKTKELLDALKDSATREAAYNALTTLHFSKSDVSLLEDALFKKYGLVYEWSDSNDVNHAIASQLVNIKAATTVEKVVKQYPTLENNELRWVALALLAKWNTAESYQHIADLLKKRLVSGDYDYQFMSSIEENLRTVAPIYPQLVTIMPDTTFSLLFTRMGLSLLDSSLVEKKWFVANEKIFEDLSALYLARNGNNTDSSYEYQVHNIIWMLEKIGTPAAINSLNQWIPLKIIGLKKDAAIALLKLEQKVEPGIFVSIAADPSYRVDLYDELKEMNKTDLFPKAYANQKAMAEGEAWLSASDDDDPSDLIFLSEKTAEIGGTKYKFYLFKVVYEYEDTRSEHLVVAGGFDLNGKNISITKYFGGVYWAQDFDPKKVNELFKGWLEETENYLKEVEEADED